MTKKRLSARSVFLLQVHAEKRGWSSLTGLIGSGKIILYMLKKRADMFKPGEG